LSDRDKYAAMVSFFLLLQCVFQCVLQCVLQCGAVHEELSAESSNLRKVLADRDKYAAMVSLCCSVWCSVVLCVAVCVAVSWLMVIGMPPWYIYFAVCVAVCFAVCGVVGCSRRVCDSTQKVNTPKYTATHTAIHTATHCKTHCNTHCVTLYNEIEYIACTRVDIYVHESEHMYIYMYAHQSSKMGLVCSVLRT